MRITVYINLSSAILLQLKIFLRGVGSVSGLGEIEFYIREDPDSAAQTPYTNSPSAAIIIHPTDQRPVYEFSQVPNSWNLKT